MICYILLYSKIKCDLVARTYVMSIFYIVHVIFMLPALNNILLIIYKNKMLITFKTFFRSYYK